MSGPQPPHSYQPEAGDALQSPQAEKGIKPGYSHITSKRKMPLWQNCESNLVFCCFSIQEPKPKCFVVNYVVGFFPDKLNIIREIYFTILKKVQGFKKVVLWEPTFYLIILYQLKQTQYTSDLAREFRYRSFVLYNLYSVQH